MSSGPGYRITFVCPLSALPRTLRTLPAPILYASSASCSDPANGFDLTLQGLMIACIAYWANFVLSDETKKIDFRTTTCVGKGGKYLPNAVNAAFSTCFVELFGYAKQFNYR